jgi:hypothetical protein
MSPPESLRDPALPDVREPLESPPASSPTRRTSAGSSWLLRATAVVAFFGALMGVIIAPGLRGLAKDHVVDASNRFAWTLAYLMSGLLVTLIVTATLELSRKARAYNVWKGIGASAAGLAVALAAPALLLPLPTLVAAALAVVTSFAVFAGAIPALRAKHTRAVAAVMLSLAAAGLLRIVAWNLARVAGEHANTGLYATARTVATAAVVLEAVGQMIAAAWLGTRSRFLGQGLSSLAIVLAWGLTFSAARGAHGTASPWEAAAHIALASAAGLPQPFGPNGLVVFLLAGSILLAGVAAVQRKQVVAVIVALSLSLIGRGAFDVPLHALAAAAAALWITIAVTDERAIWQTLLATRGPRMGRPPSTSVVASRAAAETQGPTP